MTKIFIFSTHSGKVNIKEFVNWADKLPEDYILRTSGSHGLDSLVMNSPCKKEVYIPWQNFNDYRTLSGDDKTLIKCPAVTKESIAILESCVLGELKGKYKKIDNRLLYGILGKNLKDPVDLIIINNISSKELPTTTSALVERIAVNEEIPVVNLNYESIESIEMKLKK